MTNKPSLTSILRNPHFVQLSAFLGVPIRELFWSARHPEVPARLLFNQMAKIAHNPNTSTLTQEEKIRFIGIFADFASQVVMADLRLTYTESDMNWLVEVLDNDQTCKVTLAMLFACASCREHYLTPSEVAQLLDENEVVWRRKAQRHEVPGTIHKSRGYLIPLSGLKAIGLLLDYHPQQEDEGEEINDDEE